MLGFFLSVWPSENDSGEFSPWCLPFGSGQLRTFPQSPFTNAQSLAAPCIKKFSATYLACRSRDLSNCMYIGSLWQAFQTTMQATCEPPTQNTCVMPQVYVVHYFWQLSRNQAPSIRAHIPQLGSKGVMSHILGARANFWSYYWVFALAMIFAAASQVWGRLKTLVISIFPMFPSARLCFESRWSLTFPFLGCWWASSLMQSPTTAKDQRLREVEPAPGHMQVILCPKNSQFGLCQAGYLLLRGGTWSVLEWRLLWERQGCPDSYFMSHSCS